MAAFSAFSFEQILPTTQLTGQLKCREYSESLFPLRQQLHREWASHPPRRRTPSSTSLTGRFCKDWPWAWARNLHYSCIFAHNHSVVGLFIAWRLRHQSKTEYLASNRTQKG